MAGTAGASTHGLVRRLVLTYRYLGLRTMLWRAVTFPLRWTPLKLPLGLGTPGEQDLYAARRWQRREAPPLTTITAGQPLQAPPGHDLLVLGEGVEPDRDCAAALQRAAHQDGAPVTTGRLLAADGTIAAAGLTRSVEHPDALEPRYGGSSAQHGPAQLDAPVLAAPAELALVRADALGDTASATALSLAAWEHGHDVRYVAAATAHAKKRGTEPFFSRLDDRPVHTPDGRLRIAYVTQETTVGGGHRDIFEHLNRLGARGHEVSLFTLGPQPDWFELDIAVTTCADWGDLVAKLAELDAIKIATWWRTAEPVWRATRRRGLPVYFVQDIETSYYPDDAQSRDRVLATYRNEFAYLTISGYNRDGLAELGLRAEVGGLGIDLDMFRPLENVERRDDMLLAVGRGNPLKNLDLTIDGWNALDGDRPELTLFGIEPELGRKHGTRYLVAPSDEEVNTLFNEATIFIQTSRHEGFALPPLEAMATGGAVVCTDAHGNRDFCVDGVNCLMPEPTVPAVRDAIRRLLDDPELRHRLGEKGLQTAQDYAWERRIDQLETFLGQLVKRPG